MFAESHENNSVCLFEVFSRNLLSYRQDRINLKTEFLVTSKLWKDKKKFSTISTNEKRSDDQQPLEKKIEDEKLIKQLQEKKLKRKALAEKNTALKEASKKRRRSRPDSTEKELWERLDTLNNKFKVMKDLKKKKQI